MRKITVALFFCLFFALAAFAYVEHENNLELKNKARKEVVELSTQVTSLETELGALRTKIEENSRAKISENIHQQAPKTEAVVQVRSETNVSPQEKNLTKPEWRSKYLLRQVQEHLALSDGEQKQLTEKFSSGGTLADLSSVVGKERAEVFEQADEAQRREEEENEISDQLFKISREIGLTKEQEDKVRSALEETKTVLKAQYETLRIESNRAMELHSSDLPDAEDRAELRSLYERYKTDLDTTREQENQLFNNKLTQVLSDEQLNKLLEMEAKQRSGLH